MLAECWYLIGVAALLYKYAVVWRRRLAVSIGDDDTLKFEARILLNDRFRSDFN